MKETVKKWSPDKEKMKNLPFIHFLGERIHEHALWHINRRSVSLAIAVGIFCAWIPIPIQTITAIFLALYIRCNMPVAVGLIWLTNPLTIPPMFYFAYRFGAFLIGEPIADFSDVEMTAAWFWEEIQVIWLPLIVGSFICGIVSALGGYVLTIYLWCKSVIRRWQKRQSSRQEKKSP